MSKSISTHNSKMPAQATGNSSYLSSRQDFIRTVAYFWIVAAAVTYCFRIYEQTRIGLTDGKRLPLGVDFINYWGSSALAWQGRIDEIYDWDRYHSFLESIAGAPIGPFHYSYPPVLLLLTLPFIALPYVPSLAVWLISGWYAFYRALRLAMPGGGALLLALATPAVFFNANAGQNGFWTAALLGGGLCLLQRAPVASGVMLGLLIYKPHMALLIPVALLAGRQWRAFIAAAVTLIVLLAASLLAFGSEFWADYFERVASLRKWILEDSYGVWHWMISIFVSARTLGAPPQLAYLIQAAAAIAAGAVVAIAWYRDAPAPIRYSLLVLGNLVATPYLHDYDLVVGAFVAAWLVGYCSAERLPDKSACVVAFLLLVLPVFAASLGRLTGVSPGPLFLIPAFILTVRLTPGLLWPLRSPVTR